MAKGAWVIYLPYAIVLAAIIGLVAVGIGVWESVAVTLVAYVAVGILGS